MIKIEIPGMKDFLNDMDVKARAIARANVSMLNKVTAQAKTLASKTIRETYNIKASDLSEALKIEQANISRPSAALVGRGKAGIPLIQFGGKWTRPTMGKRKLKGSTVGASVMVKKGNRKVIPGTFIAKMKSGHVGIFERTGKKRLPIRQLFGPQPALLLGQPNVVQAVKDMVADKSPDLFAHELDFYSSR